jgi:hypothetical protein
VFAAAEAAALLAFRKIPDDHLFPGVGTNFFIAFIVALPMIAGVNGFYSVRRRLSSTQEDAISVLSVQFLITIITAYAALLVCMEPIAKVLQLL